MRPETIADVARLVPHSGNMVLIDEIVHYDQEGLTARARIHPQHVFLQPDGTVPVWLAIEIMAQGIAAFDGCHAVDEGRPVRLGFLLGARRMHFHADALPLGAELEVQVKVSTSDGQGFGVFDAQLAWLNAPESQRHLLPEGRVVAVGALNVYQPGDNAASDSLSSSPDVPAPGAASG